MMCSRFTQRCFLRLMRSRSLKSSGVLTLIGGQIFGGDSGFLYTGTYTEQGTALKALVHIKRYASGAPNVMGRDTFDLNLTGTLQGNALTVTGSIPDSSLSLSATLTKQGDLPARA
jgi:hypothetical protein